MVRFACFGASDADDDIDNLSHRSGESAPLHRDGQKALRRGHSLFSHKHRVLTRDAAKVQFKKLMQNIKRDHADRDRHVDDDEFIILGKIYSEDTSVDFNSVAANSFTLSHLLPFILNTLLYGSHDHTAGSAVGSSRSAKRSALLKLAREPKEISLDATAHLVKAQCERQMEAFLYKHAMMSLSFALECMWYMTASLHLGPKDAYHRTMTLLLGLESVVTNSTPPGDLFKKAEVTETSLRPDRTRAPCNDDDVETVTPPFPRTSVTRAVDLDISGSGENDHRMHFNALQLADEVKLKQWLDARHERATLFHAEMDFVKCLTHISNGLFEVERELRRDVLRRELEKLNDFIPSNVFIPTERRPHRVLRIVPEEAHVFSTKERVPYLLVVEVEDLLAPAPEKEHAFDEHRGSSPLRRIGSLSSAPGRQHANPPPPEAFEPEVTMQNQPADKFQFSPDVTADVRSIDPEVMKRESSFRVDAKFDDDKRPPDEELLKALGERWAVKSERLRTSSKFGSNPNWRLVSCIVKARDQLRQEMFAQRLIQEFSRIFEKANIPCWLRPYEILSTSGDSGLIETVTDAKSIDSIKKHSPNVITLKDYFVGVFGGRGSQGHKRAVRNFVHSMAGYSIVQYLMNIKDRHNGNLMIDAEGHIIHIDFGFLLSNSPGGNMEFEKAPFKLTEEMVQVMGGSNSGAFKLYRKLCVQGYLETCRYANKILLMVDTMYPGNETMPCFLQGRDYVLANLRDRLGFELSKRDKAQRMSKLIDYARGNWTTRAYDHFQKVTNGISK
eukprot:TRINITY_DN47842_c0_g1_i1.p1 TRINITY_DN47842_c0_g1~~TRINITY_DN47842_c0_g1_i1.p1  ORF type:complete len:842 (-),score=153.97 TRINITY_DN47842_c0_g1_i1:826-3180(-)